ncbi:predicted protein [Postia placenta Mad-698-R]|nr:predicted protein [Postia placenta Mad-698-R]
MRQWVYVDNHRIVAPLCHAHVAAIGIGHSATRYHADGQRQPRSSAYMSRSRANGDLITDTTAVQNKLKAMPFSAVNDTAAILHHIVSPKASFEDIRSKESRRDPWLADVETWKELCKRSMVLDNNWAGRGFVLEGGYRSQDGVWSFQIDEEQQTMLSLSRAGGMTVHAMEDNRMLWRFSPKVEDADPSQSYLSRSMCELSEGFLAFPSRSWGIEIWRRTSDVPADPSSHSHTNVYDIPTPIKLSPVAAHEFQFEEAQSMAAEFPLRRSEEDLRGRYTPHAFIGAPHVGVVRIFRLRFPVLVLMSSEDDNALLLFDVRDGALLQCISFLDTGRIVGAPPNFALVSILECVVMDLDVTESYISVCFPSAVVIVPRCEEVKPGTEDVSKTTRFLVLAEDRPPQLYQEIGMESGKPPGVSRSWVAPETRHPTEMSLTWVAGADALEEMEVAPPWEGLLTGDPRAFYSPFIAARFSPDGRHLAAINAFGLLYLVPNFTRIDHEIVSFSDIDSYEIFIVNVNPEYHCPDGDRDYQESSPTSFNDPFQRMSVLRLMDFGDPVPSRHPQSIASSDLQVTHTALWTIWDPLLLERVVCQRTPHDARHLSDAGVEEDGALGTYDNATELCLIEIRKIKTPIHDTSLSCPAQRVTEQNAEQSSESI